jgi:hypothetical protein
MYEAWTYIALCKLPESCWLRIYIYIFNPEDGGDIFLRNIGLRGVISETIELFLQLLLLRRELMLRDNLIGPNLVSHWIASYKQQVHN